MKIWIVQWDCQDYYCDGDHLLGVFATREAAQQAASENQFLPYRGKYEYVVYDANLDEVLDRTGSITSGRNAARQGAWEG